MSACTLSCLLTGFLIKYILGYVFDWMASILVKNKDWTTGTKIKIPKNNKAQFFLFCFLFIHTNIFDSRGKVSNKASNRIDSKLPSENIKMINKKITANGSSRMVRILVIAFLSEIVTNVPPTSISIAVRKK